MPTHLCAHILGWPVNKGFQFGVMLVSMCVNAALLNDAVQRYLAFQKRGGDIAAVFQW